jgi:hypothetical protein
MDLPCHVSQTNLLPFVFIDPFHASTTLTHNILIALDV